MTTLKQYVLWIMVSCILCLGAIGLITLFGSIYRVATYKPELACRDGKLYEVSYEQNITIYDPTFDDCEEIK